MSSDSDFVFLATEEVVTGRVIPVAWVEEALSYIDDVAEHLKSSGVKRNRILAEKLEDAAHCLSSARDGELPEDSVWPN